MKPLRQRSNPANANKNGPSTKSTTRFGAVNYFHTKHMIAALGLLGATSFWLFAQISTKGWDVSITVIQQSAVVLSLCFILDNMIQCIFPLCKRHRVMAHFSLGLCQHTVYAIAYLISANTFASIWQPVYFGYYMWTNVLLITNPHQFFPMFHLFYSIHHSISFIITGSWILVSTCCPWETYIVRAVVIWLCSDMYLYGLNVYRSLCFSHNGDSSLDKALFLKLKFMVFCLERIQRCIAYVQAFVASKGDFSSLAWTVFWTGLFNDVLDASFQLRSLCRELYSADNIDADDTAANDGQLDRC